MNVQCNVCRKARAVVLVRDSGLRTYPACAACAGAINRKASAQLVRCEVLPLTVTALETCPACKRPVVWRVCSVFVPAGAVCACCCQGPTITIDPRPEIAPQCGQNAMGLRWASLDSFRITAYAEGGYSLTRRVPGVGWIICHDSECPADVEAALCAALGIAP